MIEEKREFLRACECLSRLIVAILPATGSAARMVLSRDIEIPLHRISVIS